VLLVEAFTMAVRAASAWSGVVPPIGGDPQSTAVLTWITMLSSALLSTPLLLLLGLGQIIGDLRYRNDLLQHLLRASPIGMLLSELDSGRLREANPAFLAHTGHTANGLETRCYADLFASAAAFSRLDQQLRREQRCGPLELEWLGADGVPQPVRLAALVVTDPQHRRLVWSLVEDVSEQHRIQRAKSELVAVVSHELRTPLTALMGAVGLVAGTAADRLDAQSRQLLQIALGNGQRLRQLVDDLLDFDRLVAGRLRFHVQPQPLRPLLESALGANQTFGAGRGVRLRLREPVPEASVSVDGPRLLQVLGNLLSNAVKFSPAGETVEVSAQAGDGELSIEVVDHGPGVPEQFRAHLFERFTQADASDTRALGGSGLGLAIAKEMIERMGGRIGYQPADGGGACFRIVLPRA
jgi:signal transduction histidine kinase